jgi:hypothetical protein
MPETFGGSRPSYQVEIANFNNCMRILLRDRGDQVYYGGANRWVNDASAAIRFGAIDRAVRKALEFPARSLVVVLRYEDYHCELALDPCLLSQTLASGVNFGTGADRIGWDTASDQLE